MALIAPCHVEGVEREQRAAGAAATLVFALLYSSSSRETGGPGVM